MSVPAYEPTLDEAADLAAGGEVVYLHRHGRRIAISPGKIAAAGAAAVEALEDAEDIRDAEAALAEPGEPIPAERLWAELGL